MPSIFLATNTETTPFPPQFVNAKGERYIIVRSCKAATTEPVYMCSDFISRDTYLDRYVCFVNENYLIDKKYKYITHNREFKVWFKNIKGESLTLSNFILELELIYT